MITAAEPAPMSSASLALSNGAINGLGAQRHELCQYATNPDVNVSRQQARIRDLTRRSNLRIDIPYHQSSRCRLHRNSKDGP
jgi:hypothetical protein